MHDTLDGCCDANLPQVDSPALQAQLQVVMDVSPECTEARLMTVDALFASGDYGCACLPALMPTPAPPREKSGVWTCTHGTRDTLPS